MKTVMTILFFMVCFSLSSIVHSSSNGIDFTYQACSKLYFSSKQKECAAIVASSSYFSEQAVSICLKLYTDADKFNCIKKMANIDISSFEVKKCDEQYLDTDKLACLYSVKRTVINCSQNQRGSEPSRVFNNGIEAAAELCKSFDSETNKKNCYGQLNEAYYYSEKAVNVCQSIESEYERLNCVSGITNIDIRSYEADNCSKFDSDYRKKICLLEIKRVAPKN